MVERFPVAWRAVLGAAVIAIPICSSAASAHPGTAATAAAPCTAPATQVWLGDGEGGGTAGTYYYPLEFSNVGRRTCTLYGYPGVSAFSGALKPVGPAAAPSTSAHATVTLAAGATAHVLLGIRDWGVLCAKPAAADGLKVYPPGQSAAKEIGFPFDACAHQGVLVVGPIRGGVGIPGYTS